MKTITSVDEICYYLKKICASIRSMPSRITVYFQVIVYRYIIYQRNQISLSMMNHSTFEKDDMRRNVRKKNKLMAKLTKLLFVSHHDHTYVKSIQMKSPSFSCLKKKMIMSYCRKLGAYKY